MLRIACFPIPAIALKVTITWQYGIHNHIVSVIIYDENSGISTARGNTTSDSGPAGSNESSSDSASSERDRPVSGDNSTGDKSSSASCSSGVTGLSTTARKRGIFTWVVPVK